MRKEVRDVEEKSQMELISRMKNEKAILTTLPENDADQKREADSNLTNRGDVDGAGDT
jgi:hypothetical protein